ncbi:MAG TPA: protein kinase, partial [Planctomycetota bacterium]|nr:protein kinase [Planctomycetota bacterium]
MGDDGSGDSAPILVIDDEELNHRVYNAALAHGGYTMVGVRDPREAAAAVRKHRPCLILLDINMPHMDGLAVLQTLRKFTSVPVLMVTGLDQSAVAVKALRLGAFDYLNKPVNFKRLLATIHLALATEPSDPDDRRIAQFRILRELGRGGMGIVYEAEDKRLERRVAVKVLNPEISANLRYELKFLREARAAAKVSHPGIVTVFEAARHRGQLFIAMELVEGETFAGLLGSGRRWSAEEAAGLVRQAAEALRAAHEAGILHRDVKPGNLMLTSSGTVKVLDFGLARDLHGEFEVTAESGFAGTMAYASPEQLQNHPLDARTDVYSLGTVLYE